jgi:hypothetical protein
MLVNGPDSRLLNGTQFPDEVSRNGATVAALLLSGKGLVRVADHPDGAPSVRFYVNFGSCIAHLPRVRTY